MCHCTVVPLCWCSKAFVSDSNIDEFESNNESYEDDDVNKYQGKIVGKLIGSNGKDNDKTSFKYVGYASYFDHMRTIESIDDEGISKFKFLVFKRYAWERITEG